jgi:hypothetical protein
MVALQTAPVEPDDCRKLAADLSRHGFGVFDRITDPSDVRTIREDLLELLSGRKLDDARLRNLGDGVDDLRDAKILKILSPSTLQPQLLNSRFFQRALHVTRAVIGADARLLYDCYSIISSPNRHLTTATPWHQDCAYWRIKRRAARRLHWWLPLQDVGIENGCMQFIPGSHLGPVLTHAPRSAGAYALRANSTDLAEPVTCPLAVGGGYCPSAENYPLHGSQQQRRCPSCVDCANPFQGLASLRDVPLLERPRG